MMDQKSSERSSSAKLSSIFISSTIRSMTGCLRSVAFLKSHHSGGWMFRRCRRVVTLFVNTFLYTIFVSFLLSRFQDPSCGRRSVLACAARKVEKEKPPSLSSVRKPHRENPDLDGYVPAHVAQAKKKFH